jgi:hypothetical protein
VDNTYFTIHSSVGLLSKIRNVENTYFTIHSSVGLLSKIRNVENTYFTIHSSVGLLSKILSVKIKTGGIFVTYLQNFDKAAGYVLD